MIHKKKSENFITLYILGPDAMHAGWSAMMRELNRKSKKHSETVRPNVDPQWRKQVTITKMYSGSNKMEAKDRCLCFPGSSSSGTPRISPPVLFKSEVLLHILLSS